MGASFQDLVVWQRAVQLSVAIYKLTASFPAAEQFGLTNQLRRASVSVASNIAEGYGKSTRGELRLSPWLTQTVKTMFAVRCEILDRQDHFIAF